MPDGGHIVGVGVFTVPEAARLTRLPAARVRRWVFGHGGKPAPLVRELPPQDGQDALGFLNLVEVLFLAELRKKGLRWSTIRRGAELARRVLGDDHPLATGAFHTDGQRGFWLELAGETGDRCLIDLVDGNGAMLEVLEQSFRRFVEFDAPGDRASLWQPDPDLARVVVDPTRRFGQPIDRESGVPTEVLASALRAEGGDAGRVARWWDVPAEAVRQAAAFEERFAPRLAA